MAGYVIDENKNFLKGAEAINSLYENAPDNPVPLWTNIDSWADYMNSFLSGLNSLMKNYIANTSLDLNDNQVRVNLYTDWITVFLTGVSGISSVMEYCSNCLSFYEK